MIRHPLHTAIGRTRPDITRLTDGIANSLRQFSISAHRSAGPDNNSNNDNPSRRPSSRERAAAAVDELIATIDNVASSSPSRQTFATSSGARPTGNGESLGSNAFTPRSQGPNVITVKSPRGGLNFRRVAFPEPGSDGRAPNIIRGGFRGRGRGRGRGGGRGGRRDDRPRRGRRRDGEDGDRRFGGADNTPLIDDSPRVRAYLEERDTGSTLPYNPSLTLESLAGWGPAVGTGNSYAQGETALRQARVLGGGQHFHPQHYVWPNTIREWYGKSTETGLFVPPSDDARLWTKQVLKDRPIEAPEEVKTAVLEDALLGKYDGPKYADPSDTIGTLKSYMKRHGTWRAQAERGIEEKVRSLLGQSAGGAAAATAKAGGARAKEVRPKA
ncbi:uncharacterized protein F4822DRAFT_392112 [Hypoxylon trugodes]|uniref:uncharacterized protein n=1 Tax=Hypoxylon trugodes TaxID=326681 RepID=UPI0021A05A05|nr:uncharacterized protein F4822DRAFT_392112 [Hypoxylon trugodes]KAI1392761.1 hypothetical protein F4822DRAFT_392112 [Hypoxylon trugodes]